MQVAVHENMNGMAVCRYAGTPCHLTKIYARSLAQTDYF